MTYYTTTAPSGQTIIIGVDADQMISMPVDEANSDYQAYLAWLAEGNTPQPWPPAE